MRRFCARMVRPGTGPALAAALAFVAASVGAPSSARAARCRLALALAIDISSSVNEMEYALQRDGLARALRTPEVIRAMLFPQGTAVAVSIYEWSSYNQQDVVIPWTLMETEGAVRALAGRLQAHRRPYADLTTALGKAVEFGAGLLAAAPACARKVLDVSGDGENNDGAGPDVYRSRGKLNGITINGLVIEGTIHDPAVYYRNHVIQGPGAFLALARDYSDYPPVIIDKLLREMDDRTVVGAAR